MDKHILVERSPTAEEYQMLHDAVRWANVDVEATSVGLRNSLFSVCVTCGGKVVGCGRVVGDAGMYFYIQDVIVLPEFQKKGIGKRIMNAVVHYLSTHAHANAFIGLMAAEGVTKFYEKHGFVERPFGRPGMYWIWDK